MLILITETLKCGLLIADAYTGVFSRKKNAFVISSQINPDLLRQQSCLQTRICNRDTLLMWENEELASRLYALTEPAEEIVFACTDLENMSETVKLAGKVFPDALLSLCRLFSVRKKDILKAISERSEISSIPCSDITDASAKAVLLLKRREKTKKTETFRVFAEISFGDFTVNAQSDRLLTKDAADTFIDSSEPVLHLTNRYFDGFSNMVSLHKLFRNVAFDRGLLKTAADELFESGCITNPYSLGKYFPEILSDDEIFKEYQEEMNRAGISMAALLRKSPPDFGIIPLKQPVGGTIWARKLYSLICCGSRDAVRTITQNMFSFTASDSLTFSAALEKGQSVPRGRRDFVCTFRISKEGVFGNYLPDELVRDLAATPFPPYICMNICDYLVSEKLAYIDEKGVHLTNNGRRFQQSVPSVPVENNESENAESGNALLLCPFCGKNLKNQDGAYHCDMCGAEIPRRYACEGNFFEITEKDIENLHLRGKSGLKFVREGDTPVWAGYLVAEGGSLVKSNESPYECPHCGGKIHVSPWGFMCTGCGFSVPFIVHGIRLSGSDIVKLLSAERTGLISNLQGKSGPFAARLLIDGNNRLHYFRT